MKESNKTVMHDAVPAHEGRGPTQRAECKSQPGADVRIANDALEARLSAEPKESGSDEEHGGSREGGHVSQSVHGEVGADGVADNDEYVLWMLKEGLWVM